jgi:hypothetical protein
MEALAAVGLAGNIVQFIHFGCSLIFEGRQIYISTSGLTEENTDLHTIAGNLNKFITTFRVRNGDANLASLAVRCQEVAQKLSDAVSSLAERHELDPRYARYKAIRQALKSMWGKGEIKDLQQRLESLRDQLTLHLVSRTR